MTCKRSQNRLLLRPPQKLFSSNALELFLCDLLFRLMPFSTCTAPKWHQQQWQKVNRTESSYTFALRTAKPTDSAKAKVSWIGFEPTHGRLAAKSLRPHHLTEWADENGGWVNRATSLSLRTMGRNLASRVQCGERKRKGSATPSLIA